MRGRLFQSTLPREERRGRGYRYSDTKRFQSTLPREERRCIILDEAHYIKFQSTLPREERPTHCPKCMVLEKFQSTLPREERHYPAALHHPSGSISIHAPARGATNLLCHSSGSALFQSTLPREERLIFLPIGNEHKVFQSTLPREERRYRIRNKAHSLLFQSTLPREERRTDYKITDTSKYFNPRSRERSDEQITKLQIRQSISIHAPARGATVTAQNLALVVEFQSTLPREERPKSLQVPA